MVNIVSFDGIHFLSITCLHNDAIKAIYNLTDWYTLGFRVIMQIFLS